MSDVGGGKHGDSRALPSLLDNTVISRQKKKVVITNYKAIVAGKNLEIYEFSKPLYTGFKPRKKKLLTPDEIMELLTYPEKYEEQKAKRHREYKIRNAIKATNNIRRLTQMNFEKVGKFLTLTFADTKKFDIRSLSACLPKLQSFIKKLSDFFPNMRYLSVPEFQDKKGRGAVHYHLVMDIPFIEIEKLRKLWRYGFIKINKATNPLSIGLYMAKYLGKAFLDPRFDHQRRYYASKNLIKPTVKYGDYLGEKVQRLEAHGIHPNYTRQYNSDWHGQITYSSYNLYQSSAQESNHE